MACGDGIKTGRPSITTLRKSDAKTQWQLRPKTTKAPHPKVRGLANLAEISS
jgi:hypothetical protein